MQDGDHVRIAGHHPGMNEWIPVNRIFAAQPAKKRIGIRQHIRLEEMIEAEARVDIIYRAGLRGRHGLGVLFHPAIPGIERLAAAFLHALIWSDARSWAIWALRSAIVGASKRARSGTSTPNFSRTRAIT